MEQKVTLQTIVLFQRKDGQWGFMFVGLFWIFFLFFFFFFFFFFGGGGGRGWLGLFSAQYLQLNYLILMHLNELERKLVHSVHSVFYFTYCKITRCFFSSDWHNIAYIFELSISICKGILIFSNELFLLELMLTPLFNWGFFYFYFISSIFKIHSCKNIKNTLFNWNS